MPQHVTIVGGGVGGTIVANLLARHLEPIDATVTLIESTGQHAYMPGWLYLPFNHEGLESDQIIRGERGLLKASNTNAERARASEAGSDNLAVPALKS